MILLDGKKISIEIAEELKVIVASLSFKPKLAIVCVGERADSISYIKRKIEYGKVIGVDTDLIKFPENVSEEEIINSILKLNDDANINGIIVQLPLPNNLNKDKIINAINYKKDVDGLTDFNISKLVKNEKAIVPATSRGVMTLLNYNNIEVSGKSVVVVGRSLLAGKSIALLMSNADATVTICHSKTTNLKEKTKEADILVCAMGKPKFINKDYVKEGQVVVDVGISFMDESIAGDVDFEEVKGKVSAISPVPGGVGPMTVTSLFQNLLDTIES